MFCIVSELHAGPIASLGDTNNVEDFDGYVNEINGGRWSYLDQGYSPYNANLLMQEQYIEGFDWAADADNPAYVWFARFDGAIHTDTRGMAYNYTIDSDESGWVRVKGMYSGPGGKRIIINKSNDTNLTSIDSNVIVTLVNQYNLDTFDTTFDFVIPVAAGNDLLFIGADNQYYYEDYKLQVTITAVSEPVTTIEILNPNGNQMIQAGEPYTINWQSSGLYIQKVDIEYSTDNGSSWKIAAKDVPNNGSFVWNVLSGLNSDECLIKVSCDNPLVIGISNDIFTIFENQSTADLNGDYFIDISDLTLLVNDWLESGN